MSSSKAEEEIWKLIKLLREYRRYVRPRKRLGYAKVKRRWGVEGKRC